MNIYEKILRMDCTGNEEIIRKFILHDPHQFSDLQIEAIVRKCHVSRATVYRFCDKLELKGISDLKVKLISDYDGYQQHAEGFNFDYPVVAGVSGQEIVSRLKEDYEKTILATNHVFDTKVLEQCAWEMKRASHLDIYTSAGNIFFADNFAFQLSEIGKDAKVPHEEYYQSLTAASSDETHFAIIITFGGRGALVEKIMKNLIRNRTVFLMISSQDADHLNLYADYRLILPNTENHADKISSFSTRMSLLYILDSLYTAYFELDYDENVKKKKEFYHKMTGERDV